MYKFILAAGLILTTPLSATIGTLKEKLAECHQKSITGISIPEVIALFTTTMEELQKIREDIENIELLCDDAVKTMLTFAGDMNAVSVRMNALCGQEHKHLKVKTSSKNSAHLPLIDKTLRKIDSTLKKLSSKSNAGIPDLLRALETVLENITAIELGLSGLSKTSNEATTLVAIVSLNVRMISERINTFLDNSDDDTPWPYDL